MIRLVALLRDKVDIGMLPRGWVSTSTVREVEKLVENRSKFRSAAFEDNSRNAIRAIGLVGKGQERG